MITVIIGLLLIALGFTLGAWSVDAFQEKSKPIAVAYLIMAVAMVYTGSVIFSSCF